MSFELDNNLPEFKFHKINSIGNDPDSINSACNSFAECKIVAIQIVYTCLIFVIVNSVYFISVDTHQAGIFPIVFLMIIMIYHFSLDFNQTV